MLPKNTQAVRGSHIIQLQTQSALNCRAESENATTATKDGKTQRGKTYFMAPLGSARVVKGLNFGGLGMWIRVGATGE